MEKIKTLQSVFNAYFALCLLPFIYRKNNIWLIGGHNARLYTDNAKVFNEYILQNHPHINIYWITDKDAPSFHAIKGQKIIKGSIKSYLYFYHAKVVLFSDTLNSDIAPFSFVLPLVKHFYSKTFKVYLSHGTIVFKKMPAYTGKIAQIKKAIFKSYDLAVASTELEKRAMLGYNIKLSSIIIAGSARHDTLKHINREENIILLAPTWRPWLNGLRTLENSDFFKHYSQILQSKTLLDYLYVHNIKIHFYLHHMLHMHIDNFMHLANDNIKILPASCDIGYEIMSSRMLITDYSSISSDFYYLQKPVLFYHFDKQEFLEKIGSEVDLENDVFGKVAYDTDTLVYTLIQNIENKYMLDQQQVTGEKYFIHFKDKENCQRIYDNILSHTQKAVSCMD